MLMAHRSLQRPSLWIALAVALTGAALLAQRARSPQVPVARVARRDLEQHLVASGRVMPPASIDVAALTTGLVTAVFASEGDRVRAKEVLVQLDDAEARAQLAQAEARVAEARARAEQVGSTAAVVASRSLEQAQATYENARQEYERTVTLVGLGALPHEERDAAKRVLEVARAQLGSAQAENRAATRGGVNARAAQAALLQAVAQLAVAKLRLAQTQVITPQEAVVVTRQVEPGTVVSPGAPLLRLAAVGATRLAIQPDERDLALLRLRARARASADAFPDEMFEAEVSYIAPAIDRERGTIDVRLWVAQPPAYLRPDMSVSVDLTVARKANAVVVASEAIRGLASARPWAWVVVNGRVQQRELRLGIRGSGHVELLRGLRPGELVVIADGQALEPWQRVRPNERER